MIASASSKTALGLAHLLKANERATVIGLTSPGNVGFVESTGAYDRVVPYGDLPAGLGDGTRSSSTSPAAPTSCPRSITTSATASGAVSSSG